MSLPIKSYLHTTCIYRLSGFQMQAHISWKESGFVIFFILRKVPCYFTFATFLVALILAKEIMLQSSVYSPPNTLYRQAIGHNLDALLSVNSAPAPVMQSLPVSTTFI